MDDVRPYLCRSLSSALSNLALLTEVWYLAPFTHIAYCSGRSHRDQARHLCYLRDIWLPCLDIPEHNG
jgi:hypothetical protein